METVEVIIKIDKDEYESIKDDVKKFLSMPAHEAPSLYKAINDGTLLPQPFDLEGLKSDMKALNCGCPYGLDYLLDCLKKRLGITIIEADREVE